MAMFAKKQEGDHKTGAEGGGAPALTSTPAGARRLRNRGGDPAAPRAAGRPESRSGGARRSRNAGVAERASVRHHRGREQEAEGDAGAHRVPARQGRRAREAARRAPQGDRGAGGRSERDDDGEGAAADGREVGGYSDAAARSACPARTRRRCWATSCPKSQPARTSRSPNRAAPRAGRGYATRPSWLVRAEKPVHQREQLLRHHRPEQQRDAAQILDGPAQRHERNEIRARVAPQDADQLAAAEPLQIQIEDDQTGHRLHQHLGGFQAGRDSGHREARLLQHATKLTPAPRIGVRQQNHYMTT